MSRHSTSPSLRTKHEGPSERCVASPTRPRAPSSVPDVWLSGLVQPSAPCLVATCPSPPRFPQRLPGARRSKPFAARLWLGHLLPPACLSPAHYVCGARAVCRSFPKCVCAHRTR